MSQVIHLPETNDIAYRCMRALQQFREQWTKTNSKEEKLALLRKMAEVLVWRYELRKDTAVRRRKQFNRWKKKLASNAKCRVCSRPAMVRHHIIQIRNGGTNRTQNIIQICFDCHAEIHPWLKDSQ